MTSRRIALALTGAAAVLLAALVIVPAATRPPTGLPPVGAAELINSIHRARSGPLSGTVHLDEQLGLAGFGGLSGMPSASRIARLWSDGAGRHRVSLPTDGGERTIVDDGATVWSWDSATRSVIRRPAPAEHTPPDPLDRFLHTGGGDVGELMGNPVDTASAVLTMLEPSSSVRLDPTALVADRPAYQLVLDPVPTERTLLREVRVAVDGQTRLPLEVTVLANGSAEPALRIGFSKLTFAPQDPALFAFAPGAGVTVRDHTSLISSVGPATPDAGGHTESLVGRGWDTVLIRRVDTRAGAPPTAGVAPPRLSTPISGGWGHGRLLSTPIGNAVLTSDGRLAVGAVPAQVLTEALSR
jgi:outer membrane lipoprotein-sorting protein